ncbi:MAG TPA: cyclic nucleotide-binding domain-containing protein [Kofleriaceae bacterium]|jgi:hypothetical protein
MATAIASRAALRGDERALVATAGLVFALASAGAAMTAAAADAMFLAELGPGNLGQAVAASSALLAVVLAVAGGLADRLDRRRVLGGLALTSAVVVAALAALAPVAPRAVALLVLVGGKQLAAATDLAFWVAIAERVDARRSQRVLPVLAATGGIGAAIGAALVVPLAATVGARGVLAVAALVLALAGTSASRLAKSGRAAFPPTAIFGLVARSWREGARAVRRQPLARHLAFVVAAAGAFGSLAYFALGVGVAARGGSTGELAELLGAVRGGAQVLVLVLQLAVAPRVLARLGTGRALLIAPLAAVAAGAGLVIAPVLAMAIATQVSARALDASLETPAERLAQTLLPSLVRGRVAGFLDGTAKRAGAVAGGLLAAALAGAPSVFYIATALAALVWAASAWRIARELPALAIAHVAAERDATDDTVDDRAIKTLVAELAGPRGERAAEVLARLHERGRVDAVPPLVRAARERGTPALWRALGAVLVSPHPEHGAALLEAARAAKPAARELAVRALGLAGGVPADAVAHWRDSDDAGVALAAELAHLRLAGEGAAIADTLADAARDAGETSRAAMQELVVELARAGDAFEPGRVLARALRRRRGTAVSRTAALHALARLVERERGRPSAELALLRADLLEVVRELADTPVADASEAAAGLSLFGALLEGQGAIEADDLHRVAAGLGELDDDVRGAAERALAALGVAAAAELIATAGWGRRLARDRAAALLAELPVTPATIDRLVDAELDALERTSGALAVLGGEDELVARRLEERLHEIAHTVLLLVAARRRSRAIARAAAQWRHARGKHERARTLAVIEAALPRPLVGRLVEAVDALAPADRATAITAAGGALPAREAAIRGELAGRDRLARALVLHALGESGRGAHRDTIARAAHAEALAANPIELLRRLTHAVEEPEGAEMPTRVETLIALGRVPLLGSLTTRQLADVAERARWITAREGMVVVSAGDPIDALIAVDDGELHMGERAIGKGDVVDELACVAPLAAPADLVVARAARVIRLERIDFEELVDDVPGLASAVCRALGERARRAADAAYRSPLASRA